MWMYNLKFRGNQSIFPSEGTFPFFFLVKLLPGYQILFGVSTMLTVADLPTHRTPYRGS